jgi:hypothetical protein
MRSTAAASPDVALAEEISQFYADPLGFVRFAYPWGEPGSSLERLEGPDGWQREFLEDLGREVRERRFNGQNAVRPIRMATASGHGIGKSTMVSWLVDWIMSTRPNAVGTITANTFPQLQSKTWAQIQRWTQLCITGHWFSVSGTRMANRNAPATWFCTPQTCREENSEAFAGQHAAASTSFYFFDEASAIPERIWEVAEGGLTDGEPMIFAWGNPTRSSGKFYRVVFGSENERWNHRSIDSRDSAMTNKAQIEEWIRDYGEDSDFVRVRVRGLPPSASELQYVDAARVQAAQKREVEVLPDEPLVAGFDVSGGGSAWNVIRFRRGLDARSIPPIRIAGEHGRDRSVLIAIAAEAMRGEHAGQKVAAMFVDSAFGSPIVERLHLLGFRNVHETNFGGPSPDHHQANMRAYMWSRMKDWLQHGAIDDDSKLEIGLSGPGYHINKSNKLVLESKREMAKRGEASPDDADALALTFAQTVAPAKKPDRRPFGDAGGLGLGGWMT